MNFLHLICKIQVTCCTIGKTDKSDTITRNPDAQKPCKNYKTHKNPLKTISFDEYNYGNNPLK